MKFKYIIGIVIFIYTTSDSYSQRALKTFSNESQPITHSKAATKAAKKLDRNLNKFQKELIQINLYENIIKDSSLPALTNTKSELERFESIITNSKNMDKRILSRKQEKALYYSLQKVNYSFSELKKACLPSKDELNRKKNADLKLAHQIKDQEPISQMSSIPADELVNKQTKSQISSIIYQRTGVKKSDDNQLNNFNEGVTIVNKYKVMYPVLKTFNWIPSFKPNVLRGLPMKERLKARMLLAPNFRFDGSRVFSPGIQFDYSLSKRYYFAFGFNPSINGSLKELSLSAIDFHGRYALGLNLSSIFGLELGFEHFYLSRNSVKSAENNLKQTWIIPQPFIGITINYGKLFKIPGSIFIGYRINDGSQRFFKKDFVQFRFLF